MELINNRYRIIGLLKQDECRSAYLCSDMWNGDKQMQLNIINANYVSTTLIDYYINEFIYITRLNNEEIIKNYSFDIVSEIDSKTNFDFQYMYTTEYIENQISLLDYIKDKDVFQIMDIFMDICKTITYLHLKGYIYSNLNLNNILVFKDGERYKLKIKDLATVKLEQDIFIEDSVENKYFQISKSLDNEPPNISHDIYSLGVLLLTMLKKEICETKPIIELEKFIIQLELGKRYKFKKEEQDYIVKILPILQQVFISSKEYPYEYTHHFIKDIKEITNSKYSMIDKERLEKLSFYTKIVGREEDISNIKEAYNSMIEYNPTKKIYLIEGDSGVGKSRLLRELRFELRLKGANVCSSFKLKGLNDDNDMWDEILSRLILESDKDIVEKYKPELKRFVPDILDVKDVDVAEVFEEHNNKYRLLNRIAGFIVESIKNKPSVIIIDNIHLADEFTLDTLTYLYSEIINDKSIILIFSYEGSEVSNNKRFSKFISDIKKRKDSETISIDNLNLDQTGELIKNILIMGHIPIKLAKKIYSKSYGNPLFITEIIKELYSNKKIYINEKNGLWHINLPEGDIDYEDLNIPNSIEQVILNQLNGINDIEYKIINTTSIVLNAISVYELENLLDIEHKDIETSVQVLLNKGILYREIEDAGYVFNINNKALKDIVYERMGDQQKVAKHKAASELLESRLEKGIVVKLDELIYHLERSNDKEKVVKYSIINAKERYSLKDVKTAINNLEKALSYTDKGDKVQRTDILLKIGEMYIEIDEISKAMECYNEAEILAESIGDKEKQGKIYVGKAELYIFKMNNEKVALYLEKTSEVLKTIECLEVELEYKNLVARTIEQEEKYEEAIELYQEVIKRCGDKYVKIKGNTCRNLAYIYVKLNRFEEAIELYEKAIELLNSVGYIRGVLYAVNNIGTVYYDNYQDTDAALEYFIKVKDISKEYGLLSTELLGLTNVGIVFYDRYDYLLAYEYLENSLKKALANNYKKDVIFLYNTLANLCIDLNDYSKAYHYYNLSLKESVKSKSLIGDFEMVGVDLYYAFGSFEKALKYAEKTMIFLKDKISTSGYIYSIKYYLIKIIVEDAEEYDLYVEEIINLSNNIEKPTHKIIQLAQIAIILYKKNDFKNANKIFAILLEASMDEKVNDIGMGYYYYAKGIIRLGEESLQALRQALKIAKQRKNKLYLSFIKIGLGDHFYNEKSYYYALNHYMGAFYMMRNIIYDIPDKYKLDFVNNYQYTKFFHRLIYVKEMLINSEYSKSEIGLIENESKVISIEELSSLLEDKYSTLLNNEEFMNRLEEHHIKKSKDKILDEKGIIANLGNDIVKNIEMIIKNVAIMTVATKGLVIIEDENQELSVIASINEDIKLPQNRHIFDRVKLSMNPILITKRFDLNEYETELLDYDLSAFMCIPIASNYLNYFLEKDNKTDKKNIPNIIGYLYLETDNMLNNFNKKSLGRQIEIINLIALLCEKYQLKKIATIDKLTGTLTRKYLEDGLNDLIQTTNNYNGKFSVIMYDLDRFKRVNDKFGHQIGDEVLKKVSKVVMNNIDRNSLLGRYGGEEFVIMLPDVDTNQAIVISNRIREKIYEEKILGDRANITVSMGVSTYPTHGYTSKELIEKADQALYNAKENGRNRCEPWNKDIINKAKTITKLDGIVTGNDVQDSRNVLAILETIQIMNSHSGKEEKIYSYIGRIIETLEAQDGYLFLVEEGKIVESYGRKSQQEEWINYFNYNKQILEKVIKDKQGIYMIDWDDVKQKKLVAGLPIWNSILLAPIIQKDEVKGIIYLLCSIKIKEFGINDLNLVNVFSNLLYL